MSWRHKELYQQTLHLPKWDVSRWLSVWHSLSYTYCWLYQQTLQLPKWDVSRWLSVWHSLSYTYCWLYQSVLLPPDRDIYRWLSVWHSLSSSHYAELLIRVWWHLHLYYCDGNFRFTQGLRACNRILVETFLCINFVLSSNQVMISHMNR